MPPLSFKRHRFPREIILYAERLYFRFIISLRDVGETNPVMGDVRPRTNMTRRRLFFVD